MKKEEERWRKKKKKREKIRRQGITDSIRWITKRRSGQQEVFSGRWVELDGDANDEKNGKNGRWV